MLNWEQFFKDDKGKASHTRLLAVLSFIPSTGVLLYIHTTEALVAYMSVYALQTISSKWVDTKRKTTR